MKKSKFTGEQIAFALRQAEVGTPVAEVCRKMGISEATCYRWKQLYGGLGPSELRKMRQFEEENQKLSRRPAQPTGLWRTSASTKPCSKRFWQKKFSAWAASGDRSLGAEPVRRQRAPRLRCAAI